MPFLDIDILSFLREAPGKLQRMNFLLLVLGATLALTGVLFIYSAGQQIGGVMASYWIRQLVWLGLGVLGMLFFACVDYRCLNRHAWWLYLGCILLLVLVLIVGSRTNGAKSWIKLGPVTLQPAEFAKLGTLLACAWLLAQRWWTFDSLRNWAYLAILAGLPAGLILLQPDAGSALVLAPLVFVLLYLRGWRKRWILFLVLAVVAAAPPTYLYLLKPHQRERILVLLDPGRDPRGAGWNSRQSMLAVGSGRLTGKGFMQGTQHTLGFLPRTVAPTDFIFAVIAEESGFLGCVLLISGFVAMLILVVFIGAKAGDEFGRLLACGVAMIFCVHFFVNVGMTMGVMPIIGIPLPLVSYGGTFVLATLCALGLVQSVYVHSQAE